MKEHSGDEPQKFELPAGIWAMLQSGRPELAKVNIADVDKGLIKPTKKLTKELIKLVADLVKENQKNARQFDLIQKERDELWKTIFRAHRELRTIANMLPNHVKEDVEDEDAQAREDALDE